MILRELHVTDLGIVDDLTVLLGPGLTAITGETGAGKTLLIEAVDLLLGGRSDASLIRARCRRGTGRGPIRNAGRRADPARAGHPDRWPHAAPTSTGASRRSASSQRSARGSWTCTASTHTSRCSPPRCNAEHSTALPARLPLTLLEELRAARDADAQIAAELAGLGGDERGRARELDLLRFQIEEIESAGSPDPDEDLALDAEEALLADAAGHREALSEAFGALEGPALDAIGAAVAAARRPRAV